MKFLLYWINMFFHSIESVQTPTEQSTIREKSKSKRVEDCCSVEQNVVPLFMTEYTEILTYTINNIQNEWFLMDLEYSSPSWIRILFYKNIGRRLTVVLSEYCIFMRVTYGIEINNDTYLMGHPSPLRTLSSTLQRTQQDNQFQCSCERNISCQKCLAFFVL